MAKHTKIKQQIRKETRIDFCSERMTIKWWIKWLKGNNSPAIKNLGYGLAFGIETGRIANWANTNDGCFLTRNHKPMTNLQTITMFAKAAIAQNGKTDTASALKALQNEMGITTR